MDLDLLSRDFARDPVPDHARKNWVSLAAIWGATFLCIPILALSFQLAPNLTFHGLIIYAILAGIFITVLASFTGWIGTATHLSSGMIFKTTFGRVAGIFPCLAIAVSTLGWFGLQTEIFGNGLQNLLDLMFEIHVPIWGCILFGAVIMSITGAIGFKALMVLSYITIPLMIYVLGWPLWESIQSGEFEKVLFYTPEKTITWSEVLTLVAGGIFGGIVANPDFTRYMKSQKHMVVGTAANFLILYPIMLITGGMLAIMTEQNDFIDMMLSLNLGVAAMVFLVLGTWTTNDTNIYGTSLPLAAIINVKKWQIAIAAAVIGSVLALLEILGNFIPFLIILGLLLAPLAGVMFGDFVFNREKYRSPEIKDRWRFISILAWIFGGLVGLATTSVENNGFEYFTFTTIPPLDGLLAAAFLQSVLSIIKNKICSA